MYKLIRQFQDKEVDVVVVNGAVYLKAYAIMEALGIESARKELNHFVIKENAVDPKLFDGALYLRSDQAFLFAANHVQFPLSKIFAVWLIETINVIRTIKPVGTENLTDYLNEEDKSKRLPKHYSTTEIAKLYGMSAQKLNEVLHDAEIIYKVAGKWVLYSRYERLGLQVYLEADDKNWIHPYWTPKGFEFIQRTLARRGFLPKTLNKDNSEQMNLFDEKV